MPDREVGLRARRPRVGRWRRRPEPGQLARDDRDLGRCGRRRRSTTWRGRSSFHSIVKYGSTILSAAGQVEPDLEELARCSGCSRSSSGNISECTMPRPAVSHCTSPRPKRAVAPSESEWSTSPCRTNVTVSNPRCGCCGNPGTVAAVVHPPPVDPGEVHADVASGQRRRRAHVLVAGGIRVEVVHAEQERVDRRPLEAERHRLQNRISHRDQPTLAPIARGAEIRARAGRSRAGRRSRPRTIPPEGSRASLRCRRSPGDRSRSPTTGLCFAAA